MGSERLRAAARKKNDEFYTQYEDIAKEVQHYKSHFKGKHVLLNANDAKHGYFWDYFNDHFVEYGLASLTATSYGEGAVKRVRDSVGTREIPLQGDGDFRSDEMMALLDQSDVVVTNPPFSLFRGYLPSLIESGKGFLVLGNQNAITYKEVWPYLQNGCVWLGATGAVSREFVTPDGLQKLGNTTWFTNMDHGKRHTKLSLTKKYNPVEYPKYDNYDAIHIDRVANIPRDYNGVMGVPITFLGKHNPDQFEVLSGWNDGRDVPNPGANKVPYQKMNGAWGTSKGPVVNRRAKYFRILIKAI